MTEWQKDLETLQRRAEDAFAKVVTVGAMHIKRDWRAGWEAIQSHPTHIPHLPRGIGYDTDYRPPIWSAEIGVSRHNPQAPLAHLIEFGSVNNRPHPAGQHALDAETPRFVRAIGEVAQELLTGKE